MNQLIVNGKELVLSSQTRIGVTYQANNIGELQNRQGTFTNTFKLPLIKQNIEALEIVNQMTSTTMLPYKKLSATYIENGIEIIGNGNATIVSVDSNSINMNIVSGNVDLIEAIGDITVGDLYVNENILPWNIDVATMLRYNTSYLVFPIVNFSTSTDKILNENQTVDIRSMLPCCNIPIMFNKLSEKIGYYFSGKYIESNDHKTMILTPSDLEIKDENLLLLQKSASDTKGTWSFQTTTPHGSNTIVNVNIFPTYNISETDFNGNNYNPSDNVYGSLKFVCDFKVRFSSNVINTPGQNFSASITIVHQIVDDLGNVIAEITDYVNNLSKFPTEFYYVSNVDTGEILLSYLRTYKTRIKLITTALPGDTMIYVAPNSKTTKFTFTPSKKITPFTNIYFQDMYRMKVKDVLKDILNLRGIIIQTNNYTKNIQFNYFDDLINNISIADDWSKKVVGGQILSFQFGNYAQKNWLRFKENENVTKELGDYYFTVNNENFDAEKTVVQIGHPATEQLNKYKGYNVPQIKAFDSDYTWLKPEHRLLNVVSQSTSFNINYTDGTTTIAETTNIPFCKFNGFDILVPEYYEAIQGILNNTKALKLPLRLTPKDISELNFVIPKYLNIPQLGIDGYFYLNKIENYKGETTLCEFVRL